MSDHDLAPDDEGRYFISVEEAGRRLNVARTSAYELAELGVLETIRYGTRRLVPLHAVGKAAEALAAGIVPPPSTTARRRRLERTQERAS